MRAILVAASLVVAAFAGAGLQVPHSAFADNSDAAHLCQQGGYAKVMGSDGTRFANTGECVSFAAHGGKLQPIPVKPVCPVTATTGCVLLSNVILDTGTGTVKLNGTLTFGPTDCPTLVCDGTASGSGTFTTSTGETVTFTVTGLEYESFDATMCSLSSSQSLSFHITETGTENGFLQVAVNPDGSNNVAFAPSFGGPGAAGQNVTGLTITC